MLLNTAASALRYASRAQPQPTSATKKRGGAARPMTESVDFVDGQPAPKRLSQSGPPFPHTVKSALAAQHAEREQAASSELTDEHKLAVKSGLDVQEDGAHCMS